MYKYKCRGCPVQEQCIEQSDLASGAKEMIRNAFAARTDTLSTWGVLQKTCLLVKEDEEMERRAREGSLLGRRVREARAALDEESAQATDAPPEGESPADDQAQVSIVIGASSAEPAGKVTSDLHNRTSISPTSPPEVDSSPPVTRSFEPSDDPSLGTRALEPAQVDQPSIPKHFVPCWLMITLSRRRISLPVNGELILGRFDPNLNDPLDVDLTLEDQRTMSVSRRHARIVAVNGRHMIKDLGSSNGLFINGSRLMPNHAQPLQLGDSVSFGSLEVQYEAVPAEFLGLLAVKGAHARHFLSVTHTGRKVTLTAPDNITLGRPDPEANFVPAVDLSQDGDVSTYVSRRHALITWIDQTPYVRDLGSTFGTRLNGEVLPPQQPVALKPGDHISLGGCVLAYDVHL
jgi:pSer/pThr/pTyr-binding forkhead associated (FHA) protein